MFKFFIDRPILSASLSALIFVLGLMSLKDLPLANYPRVSPPTVSISAFYPGADANTVSESVAAVLERQINGAEGMIYISSKCFNNGNLSMNVTFDVDRNDDLALVDVQNRAAQAESSLPDEVIRQGLTIKKQSPDILMVISLYSPKGTVSDLDLANYASRNIKDQLSRVPGVGEVTLVGAGDYGMRLWLDPERLHHYNMTVADVRSAVNDQNQLAPAGAFGQAPALSRVQFEKTGEIKGRLVKPEEFSRLVLRTNPDGSLVRLSDVAPDMIEEGQVARPGVELGAFSYSNYSRLNGLPSTTILVYQLPSGNAVQISKEVRAMLADLQDSMDKQGLDMAYSFGFDTAEFVNASLAELVKTLAEALVLVLLVVYLFLGSFRSTLIPMVAVPVSLIGVFAFFPALGLNINNLTLFALVLAVGIVVDDAIVVVEAVEVHLEKGKPPREAAYLAMKDVGYTIVGITFALVSVFLPMTLLGGLTGRLYQQFAMTLAIAVAISAFNSLTLSPALCALLLKSKDHEKRPHLPVRIFNRFYGAVFGLYGRVLGPITRRGIYVAAILAVVYLGLGGIMKVMPTSLVPQEDQKVFFMGLQMPNGTAQRHTIEVTNAISAALQKNMPEIDSVATVGGMHFATGAQSSSVASFIVQLKDWEERRGPGQDIASLIAKANRIAQDTRQEPFVMSFNLPTISGLGMGLDLAYEIENRGDNQDPAALSAPALALMKAFGERPELLTPFTSFSMQGKQVYLNVDRERAKTQGVELSSVFDAIGAFLGGSYINDFEEFGHNYKVMMQAQDRYRADPSALNLFYVRNQAGDLVPTSAFVSAADRTGPEFLTRYNLYPTLEFMAGAAPGHSTGQAMKIMEEVAAQTLPADFKGEWTGQAYQEQLAAGQTTVVLALAFMCCFLVLAGLYESLTSPFVVMVSVAVAIFGAFLGQLLRGLTMDLFMQVGLVMLIGLAAKNAILIVQFAQERQKEGHDPASAAELAGKERLRPILMTSFAFILGVLPLVAASGAGANSRHSLGTGVFSGMIVATVVGVFVIPGLYVLVQRLKNRARGF